ncbi:MAG: SprT family zinc-dependent metalloprotease [Bacteroidia bacterium]
MEELHIAGERIPYKLEKATGQRIRIGFRQARPVLFVRTPTGKINQATRDFLDARSDWILRKYRQFKVLNDTRSRFWVQWPAQLPLLMGRPAQVSFQTGPRRWVQYSDEHLVITHRPGEAVPPEDVLYWGLRSLAREFLTQRTRQLARQTQLDINEVRVKDIRSKWGSCSNQRNINLNWHLIFLPIHLIDYLIIHELMHLREMNHSTRYWQWVETYCPDYLAADKELNGYQWVIGIMEELRGS